MQLNTKDRKILAELDLNARATLQEIGKKTRLSKESVFYRIRNLEKRGIVQRYTTLVDFAKLGYTGYAVYSRFQDVDDKKKAEIIRFLSNIPELYWMALVGGKFDIAFGIVCKNILQFNNIYYRILAKYNNNLVDNKIIIRIELRQHKRNYLDESNAELFKPPFFGKEPQQEELDDINSKTLSLLSNNARMPVAELSKILQIPASTISMRIKNMKKNGIIQGYSTYIKSQNYGMQSYRLLLYLQNMNENTRNKLFSYVNSNAHTILAIETVGEWNFEITLEVESHEELQREMAKLRNNFSDIIKNMEFLIMFEDDLVYDPYPLRKHERSKIHGR